MIIMMFVIGPAALQNPACVLRNLVRVLCRLVRRKRYLDIIVLIRLTKIK